MSGQADSAIIIFRKGLERFFFDERKALEDLSTSVFLCVCARMREREESECRRDREARREQGMGVFACVYM